jgi:twitching motility two-component system response regulator PilG
MKVLVVEDTKTVVYLMRIYLMGLGLELIEATDGAQGLEMARREKPDLIISDVTMPVMDGFELCAAIRAEREIGKVPVILITRLKDKALREKGRLLGASGFLSKPIDVQTLRTMVGDFLHLPGKEK